LDTHTSVKERIISDSHSFFASGWLGFL